MTVLLDERPVVAAVGDEHVAPRENEREVGPGPDRQPVLRLRGRDREARVDDDDRDAPLDRARELLHLRVVHVLAEMRADQREAVRVLDVGRLGRAQPRTERQREADVARTPALRERRAREVDRAPRLQHVLEEELADAVVEHRHGLRPVLRLDPVHPLGDVRERLVPGDGRPLFLAALAAADQRLLQAVGVVVRADGAGAAGAQPAAALRILGIADELPEPAVAHVRDARTPPEAHLAERRDLAITASRDVGGVREARNRFPLRRGRCGRRAEGRRGDLEEATAGEMFHGPVSFRRDGPDPATACCKRSGRRIRLVDAVIGPRARTRAM